jgi:RNA polymerase sigma-70 factor (ECF subfamily)
MTVHEYNEAVSDWSDQLFGYLWKMTGHREDAENLVQSTFERLWTKRKEVEYPTAKAWMYRVARNLWIDEQRKMNRMKGLDEFNDSRSNEPVHPGLKEVVNQALGRLNEKQRSIILLRDYEGYDYKSIGEILDMNEGQVKVNLFRARKAVKAYIKDLELVL